MPHLNIHLNPYPSTGYQNYAISGNATVHNLKTFPGIDVYTFDVGAVFNGNKNVINVRIPLQSLEVEGKFQYHIDANLQHNAQNNQYNSLVTISNKKDRETEMFEGFVADLLTRYLGKYIKTLNTENLKIGIWSGDVTLENLELKKRALENFNNLPFTVKEGFLGKLSIKIPWNNLKTEPVIIIIDKLYIVATPKSQDEWDEEDEQVKQTKKLDKLIVYESLKDEKKQLLNNLNSSTSGNNNNKSTSTSNSNNNNNNDSDVIEQPQRSSFTESLRNKIVDNIQISIYNVHIRFEDTITNPSKPPYCFGLTLEHLKAQSTNEDWQPTFLHTPHTLVHKLITLSNLSVYWDTNMESPLLQCGHINELVSKMSSLIHSKSDSKPLHNYLLHPVCGSLKLLINNSVLPNKLIPAFTFNFEFNEINLELESHQYVGIMALVEWFSILKKGEKYRKYKPKHGLRNNKDRWKFAIYCVLSDIKDRLSKWTPGFIEKRRKDRLEYILLYKQKKRKKILSEVNKLRLEQLEKEYRFEDLVYFRSLADAEMKGEDSFSKEKSALVTSSTLGGSSGIANNNNTNSTISSSNNNTTGTSSSSSSSPAGTITPNSPSTSPNSSSSSSSSVTSTTSSSTTTSNVNSSISSTPSNNTTTTSSSTIKSPSSTASGGGGWFGWLGWGNNSKSNVDDQDKILENLEFTDEQKRELYSTIDYDEHQVTKNIVYPKDYVKTRMNFTMTKGSIALRLARNNNSNKSGKRDDVVIVLSNVTIKLDKFVESLYFQTILETIHVEDRFTENTVYPILMGPLKSSLVNYNHNQNNNNNSNNNNNINFTNSTSSNSIFNNNSTSSYNNDDSSIIEATDDTGSELSDYHDTNETQPLFEMWIQENPLNSDANYFIFIETLPLEVVYSKSILDSVLEFFGNAPSNTLKDIEEAARNQIKIFKDRTTLRIQYELQNHKTVDLDININAPHILVPESFSDPDAPILVLDLGSFSLNSSNKSSNIEDYYIDDDDLDYNNHVDQHEVEDIQEILNRKKQQQQEEGEENSDKESNNNNDNDNNIKESDNSNKETNNGVGSENSSNGIADNENNNISINIGNTNTNADNNSKSGKSSNNSSANSSPKLESNNSHNNGHKNGILDEVKDPSNLLREISGSAGGSAEIDDSVPKYLYDLYELQLKNIQFFIISNKQSLPLVNRFDINFSIYKCIIQSQTLLTKLKLFGDLPSLDIQLSQETIEMLIRIFDSIAPNDMPPLPTPLQPTTSTPTVGMNDQTTETDNNDNANNDINNNNNNDNNGEKQQSTTTKPETAFRSEEETQFDLINTIEQLELNPQDQLPILMVYNTIFEIAIKILNLLQSKSRNMNNNSISKSK
ncbi:hypothetical protein PPL_10289 [Heterostelium album PN500]|uniref:Chorein N-terminal domain-containing protein n=1 Tax=Heterostelium pallidum (strain ATCC 26659 / Pp 5 / PN500) TaxID=670386 RepID=D3BQV1_HETP5|nr:hypothetical protein PPL_10289 [Heterostelium album PN500]EFA76521.1 hypothetical protein PPL_10289 [Heterostelium album PN500]|eukprot:XP_020428653.1 hypothetical protein PPL_10289 [Heterostelium album PN500]